MEIKYRSILEISILTLITFGIYPVIWMFKTKKEINSLGANIPSAWLLFVPFGNLYFNYRYSEAFDKYVKKDGLTLIYFLFAVIPFILISIVPNFIEFNYIGFGPWTYRIAPFGYFTFFSLQFLPMMLFQLGLNELLEKQDHN